MPNSTAYNEKKKKKTYGMQGIKFWETLSIRRS